MRLALEVASRELGGLYPPRRSLYLALTLGRLVVWVQRWHVHGQPRGLRDWRADMTWTCGIR